MHSRYHKSYQIKLNEIEHHGILGQKWGERNGPPYPLKGGDYSESEKKKISSKRRAGNSIYNKKHFDEVLSKDDTILSTLSYNKDRTKDADMFYATHKNIDKKQYIALFNKKLPTTLYDDAGNNIGTGYCFKYQINNKLASDLKVASEDSGSEIFRQLYKKDQDFYNFVMNDNRMQSYFNDEKYKFEGYREARKMLDKIRDPGYKPSSDDLQVVYRMFNYVIPYDGEANIRNANDMARQRAKFFNACKKAGYGAVLDTNDAIYGGFKAQSPVIVFDVEKIIPESVYQTKLSDKVISDFWYAGRKALHL